MSSPETPADVVGDGAPPRLSVVMPVLNARPYLDDSIGSIVGQSLRDFELVIRDDRSTDGSIAVLRAWARRDERIVLHEGSRQLGPVGNSNWVVTHSRAPIVARMDADDVSHPDRLRRQIAVLEERPDVDVVGTLSDAIDRAGRRIRPRDRGILARTSSLAPLDHGSMMYRRAAFERVGGYREACAFWEDLDLLLRVAPGGRIAVLPQVLYTFRHHGSSTRLVSDRERVERAMDRMFRAAREHRRGRDYEHVLQAGDGRLLPRTLRGYGALQLWAGARPAVLRRMLRRADLGLDADTAGSLAWAALATASPTALRLSLVALKRLRDRSAARRIADGVVYEWQPGRALRALTDAG